VGFLLPCKSTSTFKELRSFSQAFPEFEGDLHRRVSVLWIVSALLLQAKSSSSSSSTVLFDFLVAINIFLFFFSLKTVLFASQTLDISKSSLLQAFQKGACCCIEHSKTPSTGRKLTVGGTLSVSSSTSNKFMKLRG
jgi:hypothetical protein